MENIIKKFNELELPTDTRARIIVMAAFLDEMLAKLIKKAIVKSPLVKEKSLFDFNNPFGTFGNKITLAYTFGLIGTDEYIALKTIQSIRNKAAHSITESTFDLKNSELLNEFLFKTFPDSLLQDIPDKSKASEFRKSIYKLVTADNIDEIVTFAFHRVRLALLLRIDNTIEIISPKSHE